MKKIKTLIVDDHKLVRDGIRFILDSDKEIKVSGEASNGTEAIKYLEKNNDIDVVLMDLNMPELNGIDATEIITKLYSSVNVLALTMHNEESYITSMIKSGVKGYILKDTSSSNLINAVKTIAMGNNFYSSEVTSIIANQLTRPLKATINESSLSDREIEVLKHIAGGKTNKQIAELIGISSRTVETHRRNIIKKLNLKNTAELISYAFQNNILD